MKVIQVKHIIKINNYNILRIPVKTDTHSGKLRGHNTSLLPNLVLCLFNSKFRKSFGLDLHIIVILKPGN